MQNLMPILLVLILVICYCSLGNSNNKKNSNNTLNNNNLVVCLLLVGVVVFFVMFDMNKKEEEFLNSQPMPYNKKHSVSCIKNYSKYPLLTKVQHSTLQPTLNGDDYNKLNYKDDLVNLTEDQAAAYLPNVNCNPNSPRSMFLYSHNRSSLDCCPSTYSDSRGCVCQTDDQTNMIRNGCR